MDSLSLTPRFTFHTWTTDGRRGLLGTVGIPHSVCCSDGRIPLMYEPCVKCGFRSAVLVQSGATGRQMEMCAHHYNENRTAMEDRGWFAVQDLMEAVQ